MTAGDVIVINENTSGKKGVYYDGVDDYTLVDAHAVARVAAGDTTGAYAAWIYLDNVENYYTVFSAGDNNVIEYMALSIENSGKLRIKLFQGGVAQLVVDETTASLTAKTWHRVAVVQNGVQPILYINGKAIAITNTTSTDLTAWYNVLTGCDKFAIGVRENNGTHLADFKGAIGGVKYWNRAPSAEEIMQDFKGNALADDDTYLQLDITCDEDGTTDSGLGEDDGTLTGHAHYGGLISDHSYQLEKNVTGHAAEEIQTIDKGNGNYETIIKRGD